MHKANGWRVASMALALLTPTPHAQADIKEDIEQFGKNPKEWFVGKFVEATNDFTDQLKDEIADGIFDDMWQKIGEGIGNQLGQVVGDSLASMFSLGPFLNFGSLLTVNQPSESQAMIKIILEALEAMEGRIISSIDAQYVDEVRDDLSALKNNFSDHNVRTDYKLRLTDGDVVEITYMPAAMDIIAAFEGSITSKVDNLHNYMLVNSLWIQMLAEDVQYDFLEAYSKPIYQITQQEIVDILNDPDNRAVMKEDYELRLQQRVLAINNYVSNFSVGDWRQANREMYSLPSDFIVGENAQLSESDRALLSNQPMPVCEMEGATISRYSYRRQWRYFVEGEQVINTSFYTRCSADHPDHSIRRAHYYHFLDSNGQIFDELSGANKAMLSDAATNLPRMIVSGYAPAQEMLDSWWKLANMEHDRPQNELV